ncbi:hypothetical protein F0L17_10655 [Streptomyces sp. TRM43335]|uniref:Uncharacterized protein n=1 Tax=Streptomyces taklimakanensis TaxID=2569853 RepID=A0A6G2BBX8_9ACTN|nr:hypothetical protein [Streptomyces taklimakanensis]MTE19579.1 hypothetical protein [Streptomyces taklimakanensis]
MFGDGKRKKTEAVIVLRDSGEVLAALERALDGASPEDRPGLERALRTARGAAETADDTRVRARWTLGRLEAVGFTGPLDSVRAVKALREAEPSLSLATAVALTKEAHAAL